MNTATLPAPPTVNAGGDQAAEQSYLWRALFQGLRQSLVVTVSVPFQRDEDDNQDNSDILTSRKIRQRVLDLLDEPPAR